MPDFESTTEIIAEAHRVLAPPEWDYVAGGAESETTIARNRAAIASVAFRPRVLRDVSHVDPSTTLLGTRMRIPLLLAPVGGLQAITAGAAADAVRGAATFGTLPVVSSVSEPELEVSAAAADCDKWFQLYIRGDFDWVTEMVERIRAAGYRALVLTVDSANYGNRERQVLRRYVPQGRHNVSGTTFQQAVDWEFVDRLRGIAGLPIVLKGIQTSEDAQIARSLGVDAVWVSNHGGRQLDHGRGTLDILPEVVAALAGALPIIVDGGFMRGTDILKALACGATAVAAGRLYAFALAAGGAPALVRLLELLDYEIRNAMGLLGVTAIAQLDGSYVAAATPLPAARRAFPFFEGAPL